MAISEDVAAVREDVAYIRGRIETWDSRFDDHEIRIRKTERRIWGIPGSLLIAIAALFGIPHA